MKNLYIIVLVVLGFTNVSFAQADCLNAVTVSSNGCSGEIDNTGVAGTIVPLSCFSAGANNSVWLTFVASQPTIIIDVTGSSLANTQIALLEDAAGPCGTTFVELSCNNPTTGDASLTFSNLIPGNTYYIIVDGVNDDVGTFEVCLTSPTAPPNDDPCSVIILPTSSFCSGDGAYTNYGATSEGFSICGDASGGDNSVWFNYTATTAGVDITINGTTLVNPIVQLMTDDGSGCNSAAWGIVDCDNPGGTTASLTLDYLIPGSTYWIMVDGSGGNTGSFEICVNEFVPSGTVPNDNCDNAQLICPNNSISGTTVGATADVDNDPTVDEWDCNAVINNNVWFKFVATNPVADVVFDITADCTVDFAQFEVFELTSGTLCTEAATFTGIGCIQTAGTGTVTVSASDMTAGETYYMLVDDWPNGDCDFEFTATGGLAGSDSGADESACLGDAPFDLTGATPSGGTWAGAGVINSTNGTFDPSVAGLGVHTVYYSAGGCSSSKIVTVTGPQITAMSDFAVCEGVSIDLSSDLFLECIGAFSNTTSTGIPNNSETGVTTDISVSGVDPATISPGVVTEICFTIDHERHQDITKLFVTAPNGLTYNYAPLPLPAGSGQVTLCFSVATLDGITGNTNGTWSLTVTDEVNKTTGTTNTGTLVSWNIVFDLTCAPTFSWSPTANMTGENTLNATVDPFTTTETYTVTVTDPNTGCVSSDDVTVTGIDCSSCIADGSIFLSGTNPICNNGSCSEITFSLSGGGTDFDVEYSTDGGVTKTLLSGIQDGHTLAVCPTTTTTYSLVSVYDVTDDCQGTFSGSVEIQVSEPVTAGNDNSTTICHTESIFNMNSLLDGNSAVGVWSETTGIPSGGLSGSTFNATGLNGDYTFDYTVTGQAPCPDDVAQFTITVNPGPTMNNPADITVCPGEDINIDNFVSNPVGGTFDWTNNNTAIGLGSTGTGDVATYSAPVNATGLDIVGTINIVPTVSGCAGTSQDLIVTINPTPTIGGTLTVCVGGDTQLTGSATAHATTPWSVASGTGTASITSGGLLTGLTAGTVTVTYMNTNGCTEDETVTINAPLTAGDDQVSPLQICFAVAGLSTQDLNDLLSNHDTGGTWTLNASSPDNPGANFTAATGVLDPNNLAVGSYVFDYTVTPTAPCVVDVVQITVDVVNTIALNNTIDPLCVSDATDVDLTQYNDLIFLGGDTYTWTGGNTQTITNGMVINVEVEKGDCVNDIDVTFAVNPLIDPIFTQVAPICFGASVTLPTTSDNGISGTWSPAFDNTQTTEYTFTPDADECATTTTMTVEVVDEVVPVFDLGPICQNDAVFVLPAISDNGVSGTWSPVFDNTQTGTYTFTPDAGQCATAVDMEVVVNVVEALFEATPENGVVPLVVQFTNQSIPDAGLSYLWTFGDGNTSAEENPSNTYNDLGEFEAKLVVMDAIGCIDSLTTIITTAGGSTVRIPNVFTPDGDDVNDYFAPETTNMGVERLQIFNRWGKLLFDKEDGSKWDGTFNGQPVPDGTYYYIYYGEGADDGKIYDANGEGDDYCADCKGHVTLLRK